MNGVTLCFIKNYMKSARCDKCDIPLKLRTWKNRKIALNISNKKRDGFICVNCIRNSKCTYSRTDKQLNDFVRSLKK